MSSEDEKRVPFITIFSLVFITVPFITHTEKAKSHSVLDLGNTEGG